MPNSFRHLSIDQFYADKRSIHQLALSCRTCFGIPLSIDFMPIKEASILWDAEINSA
ncbi:MAG: hypothetical protein V5804_14570 [Mucilaginibacter sp.]|uniref:hypothetical protein n=1 Tax=Mucilaginibacter sp. TaxID=1882438 RepID=UPI0034E51124